MLQNNISVLISKLFRHVVFAQIGCVNFTNLFVSKIGL